MICTVCAITNSPAALFCQGCGTTLEALRRVAEDLDAAPARGEPPRISSVPARPAQLRAVRSGFAVGPALPLSTAYVVIGRTSEHGGAPDLDVALAADAHAVSRRHAALVCGPAGWHVEDLGSTNGTTIRRRGEAAFSSRLEVPTPLADGDHVTFGDVVFVFEEG